MKTTLATVKDVSSKKWWLIDADGVPLGRLAVQVANGYQETIYVLFRISGWRKVCACFKNERKKTSISDRACGEGNVAKESFV